MNFFFEEGTGQMMFQWRCYKRVLLEERQITIAINWNEYDKEIGSIDLIKRVESEMFTLPYEDWPQADQDVVEEWYSMMEARSSALLYGDDSYSMRPCSEQQYQERIEYYMEEIPSILFVRRIREAEAIEAVRFQIALDRGESQVNLNHILEELNEESDTDDEMPALIEVQTHWEQYNESYDIKQEAGPRDETHQESLVSQFGLELDENDEHIQQENARHSLMTDFILFAVKWKQQQQTKAVLLLGVNIEPELFDLAEEIGMPLIRVGDYPTVYRDGVQYYATIQLQYIDPRTISGIFVGHEIRTLKNARNFMTRLVRSSESGSLVYSLLGEAKPRNVVYETTTLIYNVCTLTNTRLYREVGVVEFPSILSCETRFGLDKYCGSDYSHGLKLMEQSFLSQTGVEESQSVGVSREEADAIWMYLRAVKNSDSIKHEVKNSLSSTKEFFDQNVFFVKQGSLLYNPVMDLRWDDSMLVITRTSYGREESGLKNETYLDALWDVAITYRGRPIRQTQFTWPSSTVVLQVKSNCDDQVEFKDIRIALPPFLINHDPQAGIHLTTVDGVDYLYGSYLRRPPDCLECKTIRCSARRRSLSESLPMSVYLGLYRPMRISCPGCLSETTIWYRFNRDDLQSQG